jgi:hypothetical protein
MPSLRRRLLGLLAAILLAPAVAPLLRPAGSQATPSYTFTDLGVLDPVHPYSVAAGINAAGQITGHSRFPDGNNRAFRITPVVVGGQQVWFRDANQDGGSGAASEHPLPPPGVHWTGPTARGLPPPIRGSAPPDRCC